MENIRYQNCEHYISPGNILMAPMRHSKSIIKGYCTKESELYYCDGDTCTYLKFQQEELEVKTILIGVAIYFQKLQWDELEYGMNEMRKGFQKLAEISKEIILCD